MDQQATHRKHIFSPTDDDNKLVGPARCCVTSRPAVSIDIALSGSYEIIPRKSNFQPTKLDRGVLISGSLATNLPVFPTRPHRKPDTSYEKRKLCRGNLATRALAMPHLAFVYFARTTRGKKSRKLRLKGDTKGNQALFPEQRLHARLSKRDREFGLSF